MSDNGMTRLVAMLKEKDVTLAQNASILDHLPTAIEAVVNTAGSEENIGETQLLGVAEYACALTVLTLLSAEVHGYRTLLAGFECATKEEFETVLSGTVDMKLDVVLTLMKSLSPTAAKGVATTH